MVIAEKGLIRAIKNAYKHTGYSIAMEDKADMEELILNGDRWAVLIRKERCPGKILGRVAEDLRDIPKAGEAFQVKKGESQVQLFDSVKAFIRNIHEGEAPLGLVNRTGITMAGYRLWQRKKDGKLFMVDEALEDIVDICTRAVYTVGDKAILFDGMESRIYLLAEIPSATQQEHMDFLQKRLWAP